MMRKARQLGLFIDGYREVIKGSNLDIVNVTPNEHDAFEAGKAAAREDMATRMEGPFNSKPEFRA